MSSLNLEDRAKQLEAEISHFRELLKTQSSQIDGLLEQALAVSDHASNSRSTIQLEAAAAQRSSDNTEAAASSDSEEDSSEEEEEEGEEEEGGRDDGAAAESDTRKRKRTVEGASAAVSVSVSAVGAQRARGPTITGTTGGAPPLSFAAVAGITAGKRAEKIYWTEEQDELLRQAVTTYGTTKWAIIADCVGNQKTVDQCSSRWRKHVSPEAEERKRIKRLQTVPKRKPSGSDRAKWDEEIDDRLRLAVATFGIGSWKTVAEFVGGGMNNEQCSSRWRAVIGPDAVNRKAKPWDPWEDDLLKAFIVANKKTRCDPADPTEVTWWGAEQVVGRAENLCKRRKVGFYNVPGGLQYSAKAMQEVVRVMKTLGGGGGGSGGGGVAGSINNSGSRANNAVPMPGRVVG